MKEKEIIEFTDFDDYYEKNNIQEFFRLPFKLLKDSSPLDLIDTYALPFQEGNNIDSNYIDAFNHFYYNKLLFNSQLKVEYLDIFNSLSEEKIALNALKEEKLKEIQESYFIGFKKSFGRDVRKYINTLVENGELKYKVLVGKTSYLTIEEKRLWEEVKEKYMNESMPSMETAHLDDCFKQIPLTHAQQQSLCKILPNYKISTIRIFTNYENGEFILNKILNEDYLKLRELQKNALPLETFRSKVKYHSAHMKDNGEYYSLIEVLNKDEGIIKISDTLHNFLVKFSPTNLSNVMPKMWYGPNMELDEHAGLLVIAALRSGWTIFPPLQYNITEGYGWMPQNYGHTNAPRWEIIDAKDVGYIFKPENAMLNLFNNKLAKIENLATGMLNIRTSDLDLNGYKCQLATEFILELSQKARSIKEQEKIKLKEEGEKKSISSNVQLQEKQESIKQEILQLSKVMIKLSDDFRAALITEELIALSNKSLQITDHFQEFTNMLGFTTSENIVNLLGTENITDVHNDSI